MSNVIPLTVREGVPGASPASYANAQVAFIRAAANLYASALAVASPGETLDASTCHAIGKALATRGWFTGLIEIDADGSPIVTPMDAWLNRGRWIGTTRPLNGDTGLSVSAPDDAVLSVRYADGEAPIARINPLADLAAKLDAAMIEEAETPVLRVLGLDATGIASGPDQRGDITTGVMDAGKDGLRVVTVPAMVEQSRIGKIGPEPERGAVELRKQVREDVEAAYGVQGLLSDSGSTETHGYWRVATVRTFTPLAMMIEREAARKLDSAPVFRREAWIAAPHSEVARATAQRATAVQRLVAAGVDVERAIEIAGLAT